MFAHISKVATKEGEIDEASCATLPRTPHYPTGLASRTDFVLVQSLSHAQDVWNTTFGGNSHGLLPDVVALLPGESLW